MIEIYGADGVLKATSKVYTLDDKYMQTATVSVTVTSSTPLTFAVGDYFILPYNSYKYVLWELPKEQKQARRGTYGEAFVYTLKFSDETYQIKNCPFLDLVLYQKTAVYTSLPDVTVYARPQDIVDRIIANLSSFYGQGKWKIIIPDTTDERITELLSTYKDISLSNVYCMDALNEIYNQWGLGWIFTYEEGVPTIYVAYEADKTSLFRYGKGRGLRVVAKEHKDADNLVTRIFPYGGTENLPTRFYNTRPKNSETKFVDEYQHIPNLTLHPDRWVGGTPAGNYIENAEAIAKYGLRSKIIYFTGGDYDNVIPTITGVTAKDIRNAKTQAGETENIPSVSAYPDDTRMDKIKTGDDTKDKGARDASYEPLSYAEKYTTVGLDSTSTDTIVSSNQQVHSIFAAGLGLFKVKKFGTFYYYGNASVLLQMQAVNTDFGFASTGCSANIVLMMYVNEEKKQEWSANVPVNRSQDGTQLAAGMRHLDLVQAITGGNDYLSVKIPDEYEGEVNVEFAVMMTMVRKYNYTGEGTSGSSTRRDASTSSNTTLKYRITPNGEIRLALFLEDFIKRFKISIPQVGFNVLQQVKGDGMTWQISMKNGACAGYAFNILYSKYQEDTDSWMLTCQRVDDSELNLRFPNTDRPIRVGDEFVLLGFDMPDIYVYWAMERLYQLASKALDELSNPKFVYSPEIDNLQMARSPQALKAGMLFNIADEDIEVKPILIDAFTLTEDGKGVPEYRVTLRNEKQDNLLTRLYRLPDYWVIANKTSRETKNIVSQINATMVAQEMALSENTNNGTGGTVPNTTGEYVDLVSQQTITGHKIFSTIDVMDALSIPQSVPVNPQSDKVYLYFGSVGSYPEEGGGGVATVYPLTLLVNGATVGVYEPDKAAKTINIPVPNYSLPTASADALGGVKIGNGLKIDANGVLSIDYSVDLSDYAKKDDVATALADYLPLTGGTLTGALTGTTIYARSIGMLDEGNVGSLAYPVGNVYMANNHGIYSKDKGGKQQTLLYFSAANWLMLGSTTAYAGYDTYIYGKAVRLHYGTERTLGFLLNASGNISELGTLTPRTEGSFNLGSAGTPWYRLYLKNGDSIWGADSTGAAVLLAGLNVHNQFLLGYGAATKGYNTYFSGNNVYFQYGTGHTVGMLLNSSGQLTSLGSLIPRAVAAHDIGAAATQWRNLYAQTIYENGTALSGKYFLLAGGTLTGKLTAPAIEAGTELIIPQSAPANPDSSKVYLYVSSTGNYAE